MPVIKGGFGELSFAYDHARKPYTAAVIDHCNQLIPRGQPALILDLGCGTGIGTRQLSAEERLVIGVDKDWGMLEKAMAHPAVNVSYLQTAVESLPYGDKLFHAVTCFGAFHWFDAGATLYEAQWVLRPAGIVLLINKYDQRTFWLDTRRIIQKYTQAEISLARDDYHPDAALRAAGFRRVERSEFF